MAGYITAGIGAAGAIGGGLLNLSAQQKQSENQGGALQMAMQQYMLQKKALDQQYELQTAGQRDARGNQIRYVPGQGWVTDLTPESRSMLNRSDAVQNQGYVESLGRGAEERRGAFNRRLTEGSAASPLLAQMQYGYGAPTREGVAGAHKIANVTNASEGADQARGAYTAAALRNPSGATNLQPTIASLDRGATQGIRSALARGDEESGPLYQQMMDSFNAGKLNPYNTLATRASNVENMPFQPESVSGGLDTATMNRAKYADMSRANAAFSGAANPVIAAMMAQKSPNYDTFIGGLTDNAKQLYGAYANRGASRNYGDLSESAMNRIIGGGGLYG